MGCLSSKAITRSISIREELTHGFQSTTSAWEELLASHTGNDQLFALICSSNTNSTKLRTSSFTLPSTDSEIVETKHLGGAWNMITDVNGRGDVESGIDVDGEASFSKFTRSKSCQMEREKELLWLSPDQLNDNKLDWRDKNLVGSRSFHTVEEYDALLERIHKFSTTSVVSFEDYDSPNSIDENQNERCATQATSEDSPKKESVVEEDLDLNHNSAIHFVQTEGVRETGWKRKTVAKGLKSLDVSTVEFPTVARFRQRMREGQVWSPGTYVTPKFGSYNGGVGQEKKERAEDTVFSAELLAEFEECMQRLQVEEESILREMENEVEEDS